MCSICLDMACGTISPYDAEILSVEIRDRDHAKQLRQLVRTIEKQDGPEGRTAALDRLYDALMQAGARDHVIDLYPEREGRDPQWDGLSDGQIDNWSVPTTRR